MTTPSTGMVERVAAAMQAESVGKPFTWRNAARAALEAMREPTPAMIAVAEGITDFVMAKGAGDNTAESRRREMRMALQAAIDTALSEPGEPDTHAATATQQSEPAVSAPSHHIGSAQGE